MIVTGDSSLAVQFGNCGRVTGVSDAARQQDGQSGDGGQMSRECFFHERSFGEGKQGQLNWPDIARIVVNEVLIPTLSDATD